MTETLTDLPLPDGVRARFVDNGNGLSMHMLEAGYETPERPCIVLLHGFPELAYSWRKVMKPLADAGFHVIAPDQRGYGRTGGADVRFDANLADYAMPGLVNDTLGLVFALGYRSVAAVVGHDFGSFVAAWCALIRPDVFRSVVMMSAPFAGPPRFEFDDTPSPSIADAFKALASLDPPRRYYQTYFAEREANGDMWHAPQGLADFLRAYWHVKSADWSGNRPHPLVAPVAEELALLPDYYVMRADTTMPQTVAGFMPSENEIASCAWLDDAELHVYASEYARTGFQGGLNWYRAANDERQTARLRLWSGRTIDVPACFIAGSSDWGCYQRPGDFEAMRQRACTNFRAAHFIEGAGHWVQQEQARTVVSRILRFLRQDAPPHF
ncbi:alpha/beta fold hydrolase [Caballeronia sp. LZ062]|uniref:alpha/beta fold hydrolase n=1 Tax=unclassified Caballeronia TaxID=2646786 RepID=UPI00285EE738|nr:MULTISPECIES: alpha/beta fold hydrolase [unclassified Caballeronia]MDR5856087.1 alpha/beta fold hydrolase [Caballeronia sp. LZ050]MDR5872758.1 alpha/beta fold hydrolase [Caballeronia sp. LZ062]